MTRDMFGGGGGTFSQNFNSLALTDCDLWYYEDLEEKADWLSDWLTDWLNDKAVRNVILRLLSEETLP